MLQSASPPGVGAAMNALHVTTRRRDRFCAAIEVIE
jgi:hypothetical protein